jgi:hypothetical protein
LVWEGHDFVKVDPDVLAELIERLVDARRGIDRSQLPAGKTRTVRTSGAEVHRRRK